MRVTALGLLRDKCIVAIAESLKDSGELPSNHRRFCRLVSHYSNDKLIMLNLNRDVGASTVHVKLLTVTIWLHRVIFSVTKSY